MKHDSKKEKKIRMFLETGGKCEYCGQDMLLAFENKYRGDDLATFDHVYNKDHELRITENNIQEKRIYLVCNKCNNDKSKAEPNKQMPKGLEKKMEKFIPKARWTDEKFMERMTTVLKEELELSAEVGKIEKEMRKIANLKRQAEARLTKKVKYRNVLLTIKDEREILPNSDKNDERIVETTAK